MASKIQIKRGLKSKLPTLDTGELGFCTDTKEVFIGNGGTNVGIQVVNDSNLGTSNKTIVGAINELNNNKQASTVSTLNTSNKTIAGAINELNTNKQASTVSTLNTTNKTIVGAINELFQSASNGKTLVANAIANKGVVASESDTFTLLATKIGQISTGKKMARGNSNTTSSGVLTVSNLGFTPNLVIISGGKFNGIICGEAFFYDDYQYNKTINIEWRDGIPRGLSYVGSFDANVTTSGFTASFLSSSVFECQWIAYE